MSLENINSEEYDEYEDGTMLNLQWARRDIFTLLAEPGTSYYRPEGKNVATLALRDFLGSMYWDYNETATNEYIQNKERINKLSENEQKLFSKFCVGIRDLDRALVRYFVSFKEDIPGLIRDEYSAARYYLIQDMSALLGEESVYSYMSTDDVEEGMYFWQTILERPPLREKGEE